MKSPNRGRFEIGAGPDGNSMGDFLKSFRKSPILCHGCVSLFVIVVKLCHVQLIWWSARDVFKAVLKHFRFVKGFEPF